MGFLWSCYRWYRRLRILIILMYRYLNPWDTFYQHPIVFEIWGLAMDSELIAEHAVAQTARGDDEMQDGDTLLGDGESTDQELAEVLAGVSRNDGPSSAAAADAPPYGLPGGAGVSVLK